MEGEKSEIEFSLLIRLDTFHFFSAHLSQTATRHTTVSKFAVYISDNYRKKEQKTFYSFSTSIHSKRKLLSRYFFCLW